ncbi:MAG: hypothetical protein MUF37_06145 [Methanoregulaceae archaeon]|nr:hypothetical protein [Methanoregulaceae archaeon]
MQLTEEFLELIQETKIRELLKDASRERYEASGVCLKDDYLHIIFDDSPLLLRLRRDWWCDGEGPSLLDLDGTGAGYEDITYQSSTSRWYLLIEAAKTDSGAFMPRVDEFDESFAFIKSYWLPFQLESGNKGLEGLSTLYYAGNEYLLGLCEGNNCKGGGAGLRPGKGRIQAFRRVGENWEYAGTIKLPGQVRYKDYSSLDIHNGCLTILSQASSSMWVGRLRGRSSGLDDLFEDDGRLFLFPRDEKGRIIYCNLEGVTWIGNDQIAVVSDKAKAGQPGPCAIKDQSLHIFRAREF